MAYKSEYYQKLVLNGDLEDLLDLSDQIGNDSKLTQEELRWLESIIQTKIRSFNSIRLRIVNSETGVDEEPSLTIYDEFNGTAIYKGEVRLFGVGWKVFLPTERFKNEWILEWYYNEKVAQKLSYLLLPIIPGRFKPYFNYPPWLLGSVYASSTYYVPLHDLINKAISMKVIRNWDSLKENGIPDAFVDELKIKSIRTE
jgi:hypothetical protein